MCRLGDAIVAKHMDDDLLMATVTDKSKSDND